MQGSILDVQSLFSLNLDNRLVLQDDLKLDPNQEPTSTLGVRPSVRTSLMFEASRKLPIRSRLLMSDLAD